MGCLKVRMPLAIFTATGLTRTFPSVFRFGVFFNYNCDDDCPKLLFGQVQSTIIYNWRERTREQQPRTKVVILSRSQSIRSKIAH